MELFNSKNDSWTTNLQLVSSQISFIFYGTELEMENCLPAIASMSLGRAPAGHDFRYKMECAAKHGFKGMEIFFEDLESLSDGTTQSELDAAQNIRDICDTNGLTIIALQPFIFYEGLVDPAEHQKMIQKLHHWFKIVKILGTDIIQIPTQFQKDGVTGDEDTIVQDMIEVADLGLGETPPVRFAYENLCWGKYIDTWEGVWNIVQKVNRPNFGMCLDTFNIAGRIWADPEREDGRVPNSNFDESISRLSQIDISKVWYLQIVGAERIAPLIKGHEWYNEEQPARMTWSRNARLFYDEKNQYLPIEKVAKAILACGFKGWVSMELFSRTLYDKAENVPNEHARRGKVAWDKLVKDLSTK